MKYEQDLTPETLKRRLDAALARISELLDETIALHAEIRRLRALVRHP